MNTIVKVAKIGGLTGLVSSALYYNNKTSAIIMYNSSTAPNKYSFHTLFSPYSKFYVSEKVMDNFTESLSYYEITYRGFNFPILNIYPIIVKGDRLYYDGEFLLKH